MKILDLRRDAIESVILLWGNVYAFITGSQKKSENSISRFKKVVISRLCVKGYYQINIFINDNTPWE